MNKNNLFQRLAAFIIALCMLIPAGLGEMESLEEIEAQLEWTQESDLPAPEEAAEAEEVVEEALPQESEAPTEPIEATQIEPTAIVAEPEETPVLEAPDAPEPTPSPDEAAVEPDPEDPLSMVTAKPTSVAGDEDHYFIDGICIYCGYICPHEIVIYQWDLADDGEGIVVYRSVNNQYHSVTSQVYNYEVCAICGMEDPFSRGMSEVYSRTYWEQHDYTDEYGKPTDVCFDCEHKNTCAHPNVQEIPADPTAEEPDDWEYIDTDSPSTHEYLVSVTMRKVCPDCGYILSDDYVVTTTTVEPHRFEGTKTCIQCGYTCKHKWKNGVCTVCGLKCTHSFNSKAVCTICGISCPHENISVESVSEPGSRAAVNRDSGTHLAYYNITVTETCADCGKQLGVTTYENSAISGYHNYVRGYCSVCGASEAFLCLHPDTEVRTIWTQDLSWSSINNENHSVTAYYYTITICNVCGEILTSTQDRPSIGIRTEPHHYAVTSGGLTGVCSLCGHRNTCEHRRSETRRFDEERPIYANTGVGQGHQRVISAQEAEYCTTCGEQLSAERSVSTRATEAHAFDANHVCMLCSYECTHEFKDSVCVICGFVCVNHNMVDGKCTICGYSIALTEIRIPESGKLGVGETYTLQPELTPANAYADLKWTSSNTKVATVDSKTGLITAKKTGSFTLTVASGNGVSAKCKISVLKSPSKIAFSKSKAALGVGETTELSYELTKSSTGQVTLESSNPSVARVEGGTVRAIGAGTAVITATTYNGKTASCQVTVEAAPLWLGLSENEYIMNVKQTFELEASVHLDSLQWTSTDPSIATVSGSGKVTAVNPGRVAIQASTYNGLTETCWVYVYALPKSVSIEGDTQATIGIPLQLRAVFSPENANSTVTWKSGSSKIAMVDQNGIVTPLKAGTVKITATTGNGKKKTISIKVTDPKIATAVQLSATGTIQLSKGETAQLFALVTPNTAAGHETWKSSSKSVVSVDENGMVTALKNGTATITVSSDGVKATVKVKVAG